MISFSRQKPHPIGLQLGPRSATLVQLVGKPDQLEVHSLAHGEIPLRDELSAEEQDQEIAAALRKLLIDHHFKGRRVVSCLGAEQLFVQNVRLPQLPAEEVEKVVRWEAEERLPYPVNDAEIRHLLAGNVRQDSSMKQEVILLACQRAMIDRHVRLLELAGLTPDAVDIEPCAALRCLRRPLTPAEVVERRAYLNLDDSATTVMFSDGPQILFLKYIAIGGRTLDQAVARQLDLRLDEAARMRSVVNAAVELDADDEVHRSVIDAIRSHLETMTTEIEHCLRYYKVTFRGKAITQMVVTGSEATPWLVHYLGERLGIPCQIGNPFASLGRWPTSTGALERPWRWTTAMGLSMKSIESN